VVSAVIGGRYKTFQKACQLLVSGAAVLTFAESGGAADFIAEAYYTIKRTENPSVYNIRIGELQRGYGGHAFSPKNLVGATMHLAPPIHSFVLVLKNNCEFYCVLLYILYCFFSFSSFTYTVY